MSHSNRITRPALVIVLAGMVLVAAGSALGLGRPAAADDVATEATAGGAATSRGPQALPALLPGPLSIDRALPQPVPAALRAQEINAWVDATAARASIDQVDDPWAIIDQCMRDDMAGNPNSPGDDTPAASIAVAVGDVITFTRGYGVKDLTTGGEVDANTLFRIGSTTKMMTAAAVMQLSQSGAVALDGPLSRYLPEYRLGHPWDADELTLHRMLSHQTGHIDQYFIQDLTAPLMTWVQSAGALSLPLYAAPGSFWNYSNPNFSLAGAVVERLGKMPYNDYMAQRVWDPAGMPLTTLDSREVISTSNFATGYDGGQPLDPTAWDYPWLGPAGTAFSTPTEMIRWALLMQAGDDAVLSAASKRLMQTRHINQAYLPWADYGYGIMITDWRDKADPKERVVVYDHGGNIYGGSSQLFWIPDRGIAVSVLASTIRSLDYAAACAVETLAGIEMIPSDTERKPPKDWDVHVGTYSMMDLLGWPWTATVSRISNTLTLDFPDVPGGALIMGDSMPMGYAFTDVFVPRAQSLIVPNVDLTFIRDRADPDRVRYMRNRNAVGQRVGQFPQRVSLVGASCAPVRFTSELDMPNLSVHARGLMTPTRLISVPLAADNPADPSTSAIKHDFTIGEGGADAVYVVGDTEPDDAVGLYLMRDANGDGQFALADGELAAQGIGAPGTSLLYGFDPLPAGQYQLWVHGAQVAGESSTVNLDITVFQGRNLRLENHPRGLSDGATWEMRVCADDVAGLTVPMRGTIEFSYDSPPRRFRIMVDWKPAAAPSRWSVYLPVNWTGLTMH
ncbi:MAG: beta-lactamase family protein [Ardenticatenia bacterium]|nr:beta-lactamase family protein [Ardenticatenia bacterium]